jgi:hypothetical protein
MWRTLPPTFKKKDEEEEEEEEEEDTPHVDTWRNARVWVDFFGGSQL